MKTTTTINQGMVILIFLGLISTPLLKSWISPSHYHPFLEKRRLAAIPTRPKSLNETLEWPKQFERYYQDHFGFRYRWLLAYKNIKFQLNDPATDQVIFGKEPGWLFYNDHQTDDVIGDHRGINQFNTKQLNDFIQNIKAKQQWLHAQGIAYLFIITPSKHDIYPEYLPDKYNSTDRMTMKQQLQQALNSHPEINFLDLTTAIIEGKTDQRMFLKNDTHWTDFAANIAQYRITQKLNDMFPQQFKPQLWPWSAFNNKISHTGDLEQINGTTDRFPDYRWLPEFPPCTDLKQQQSNCHQSIKALIFHDSFFVNLQPFISTYLGQAHYVAKHFTADEAKKQIKTLQPDVVIEQWADRHLPKLRPAFTSKAID